MNSEIIDEFIINSDYITKYICEFLVLYECKDILNISDKFSVTTTYTDDNGVVEVSHLELFPKRKYIYRIINKIDELYNSIAIKILPEIQYIIEILDIIKGVLYKLLNFDNTVKLLLDDSDLFDDNNIVLDGSYRKFLIELCADHQINFEEYSSLDYKTLVSLQQLKHIQSMLTICLIHY